MLSNKKNKRKKDFIISSFFVFISIVILFTYCDAEAAVQAQLEWPKVPGMEEGMVKACTTNKLKICLNEDFGINDLVKYLYSLTVMIGGLAAFIQLIRGGVMWMTSAGNPSQTTDAKDMITSAITGLLLLLASYIILQLLNPDLLIIKPLR